MNTRRSAALVRRWVSVYTLGLAPEIKQRRRDEIDDDLWSQAQEATEAGRADRSLAGEILARLVFGVPADVSWRIEQRRFGKPRPGHERSLAMHAPGRGLLAIIGGIAWASWPIAQVVGREWGTEGPMTLILILIVGGGPWVLAAATIGLAFVAQDRIRPGVLAIGVLGALIGAFSSVVGAYAAIVALPVASATVLYELGRIGAIGPWAARAHIITAALVLIAAGLLWLPGFLDNPATAVPALSLRELVERRAVFDLVGFPYGLSWITIGWSLLRGRSVATDKISGARAA
jgi:hypothetical protein